MMPAMSLDLVLQKAGACWVGLGGAEPRPVWFVWQDGAVWVLTGPGEQQVSGSGSSGELVAQLRLPGGDLVERVAVTVAEATPDEWDAVLPALQAARLHAPDGEAAPERWRRACALLRLTPA